MKKCGCLINPTLALACMLSLSNLVAAQNTGDQHTSVHMLVTVEARHGNDIPKVNREDVMVYEGRDRDQVIDWVPAQGDNAALELFILLDDGSAVSLGNQLQDLRQFISSQAASTKVGVAYMQNGIAKIQQNLTSDHELAAKSLRLPMEIEGANGSPYFSLSDLIKKRWPQTAARREVLMVTDGIDPYFGSAEPEDPYVGAAIDDAQRAGVAVFGIYMPGLGHYGHSYWRTYWGQMNLSRLTDETGGESYSIGFSGAPVSFQPFLEDVNRHLEHQYILVFNPKAQKKSGWQRVKVTTEVSNAELVSPNKVYVPAAGR